MGAEISADKRKALEREFSSLGRRPSTKEFRDIAGRVGVSETTARKVYFKGIAAARRSGGESAEREESHRPAPAGVDSPAAPTPEPVEVRLQPVTTPPASMPTLIGATPPLAPPSPGLAPTSPQATAAPSAPSIAPLVNTVCAIFDKRATDFATLKAQDEASPDAPPPLPGPISAEERQALAEAWEAFILKHPELFTKYLVELNVVVITLGVFGPRLWAVWQRATWERERRAERARAAERVPVAPPAHPLAPTEALPAEDFRAGDKFISRIRSA